MVGTKKTRVKCCESIRHTYLVCRALSAQYNHLRRSATMAMFSYFYLLDIRFKHVYDMVGIQQTRVKCCQSIRHAYLVCRALSAQWNHLRLSATMAKFPYFHRSNLRFQGFNTCMTWFGPNKQVLSVVNLFYMLTGSLEHYGPSATICGTVQPWPSSLLLAIQSRVSGIKLVYDMAWTQQTRVKFCQSIRPAYLICRALSAQIIVCGPVQPWPSFLISIN